MKEGHDTQNARSILLAIAAAVLYALSSPISKLLLRDGDIPPTMLAGLLYIGAGAGMLIIYLISRLLKRKPNEQPVGRGDLRYIIAMVALDIAAPIPLMLGLSSAAAANVSLLNNFEIVATSLIALVVFKEAISKRLWAAIALVTAASALLSFEDTSSLTFSWGSLLVIGACICWGVENNCTRRLSSKDPMQIVIIKGFCSGTGSVAISLCVGERIGNGGAVPIALLLGFAAYGLSIFCYICAQRRLGAAKTSAYYAVAPFIGAILSFIIFKEMPSVKFLIALAIMAAGVYFASFDGKRAAKVDAAHEM